MGEFTGKAVALAFRNYDGIDKIIYGDAKLTVNALGSSPSATMLLSFPGMYDINFSRLWIESDKAGWTGGKGELISSTSVLPTVTDKGAEALGYGFGDGAVTLDPAKGPAVLAGQFFGKDKANATEAVGSFGLKDTQRDSGHGVYGTFGVVKK